MDLVYGFEKPHQIGSICGVPCAQCGADVMSVPGQTEAIPAIPLFIVREATYEEYVASVRANGGGDHLADPASRYFYVVSVD